MTVLRQKIITREDLRRNRGVLYLFGDNEARSGRGGQAAEMRGEPNAVGVRTKRAPRRDASAFWTDATLSANCAMIRQDLAPAFAHAQAGGIVVVPLDGLGTGLALLDAVAPRTAGYLDGMLAELERV